MEEKEHSILSASSSSRWLKCPPSAILTKDMEAQTSPYAEEGTEAHELAERKLMLMFNKISQEDYNSWYIMFKARSKFWSEEMEEYVNTYVNTVKEQSEGYTEIYFELRVDYSDIINVPDQKGTADCVIVFPDKLTIMDLKYGKGVLVQAEENSQLSLYALAACQTLKVEVSKIRLMIVQPRLENFSSWDTDFTTLYTWGIGYARERAQLAIQGKGDFCPGEKQCRFCKLRGSCNARANANIQEAKDVFGEDHDVGELIVPEQSKALAHQITLEKLSIVLEIGPLYQQWFNDVQAYAYELAMSGIQIPGFKLVQGKTNRKVDNEEGLVRVLTAQGIPEKELYKEPTLKGLGELEKLVGKKTFETLSAPFVVKPMGKPTLVPETDKRAPINMSQMAIDVFSQVPQLDGEEE